jgi:hypothetical protein
MDYKILTGHYGISKSISVMLYGILSRIIADYNLTTFSHETSDQH